VRIVSVWSGPGNDAVPIRVVTACCTSASVLSLAARIGAQHRRAGETPAHLATTTSSGA
jgi:hypothetical protein